MVRDLRKKEGRGKLLTTMLILNILLVLLLIGADLYAISSNGVFNYTSDDIKWITAIVVMIAIIAGLFTWKKLAVYALLAFFAFMAVRLVIEFDTVYRLASSSTVSLFTVIFIFVLIPILYLWAVKRKWHLFK